MQGEMNEGREEEGPCRVILMRTVRRGRSLQGYIKADLAFHFLSGLRRSTKMDVARVWWARPAGQSILLSPPSGHEPPR